MARPKNESYFPPAQPSLDLPPMSLEDARYGLLQQADQLKSLLEVVTRQLAGIQYHLDNTDELNKFTVDIVSSPYKFITGVSLSIKL